MIIGITGTNGAGKGIVVSFFESRGFSHFSVRDFLTKELKKRNIPVNRPSLSALGDELREKHGPGFIVETLFKQAKEKNTNVVIESVRSIGEAKFLKEHGAKILAVDADERKRYDRIVARGSETDQVSFEEFREQEAREFAQTEAHRMNVRGVMRLADVVVENNSTVSELHEKLSLEIERFLAK